MEEARLHGLFLCDALPAGPLVAGQAIVQRAHLLQHPGDPGGRAKVFAQHEFPGLLKSSAGEQSLERSPFKTGGSDGLALVPGDQQLRRGFTGPAKVEDDRRLQQAEILDLVHHHPVETGTKNGGKPAFPESPSRLPCGGQFREENGEGRVLRVALRNVPFKGLHGEQERGDGPSVQPLAGPAFPAVLVIAHPPHPAALHRVAAAVDAPQQEPAHLREEPLLKVHPRAAHRPVQTPDPLQETQACVGGRAGNIPSAEFAEEGPVVPNHHVASRRECRKILPGTACKFLGPGEVQDATGLSIEGGIPEGARLSGTWRAEDDADGLW